MSMKQKDAVIQAVLGLKGEMTNSLSKSEIETCAGIITDQILAGQVAFSDEAKAKYDTTEKVFGYVKGMVKNWLTKSKELNGGVKYEPETKRGPLKDATQKALEALLEKCPDNDEVKQALAEHIANKAAQKKATTEKTIDVNALPEHLRKLVG